MAPNPANTAVNQLLKNIAADVKQLRPRSAPSTKPLKKIASNDLYEAYLFMRVLSAARSKGTTLELRGEQSMKPARQIIFRMSPGTLHHASGTAPDYTFALLTRTNCDPRALFVGIKAQGYSGVTHECDVLMLPLSEAKNAQKQPNYSLDRKSVV